MAGVCASNPIRARQPTEEQVNYGLYPRREEPGRYAASSVTGCATTAHHKLQFPYRASEAGKLHLELSTVCPHPP